MGFKMYQGTYAFKRTVVYAYEIDNLAYNAKVVVHTSVIVICI